MPTPNKGKQNIFSPLLAAQNASCHRIHPIPMYLNPWSPFSDICRNGQRSSFETTAKVIGPVWLHGRRTGFRVEEVKLIALRILCRHK